jgi:hypothetical protein
LKAAQINAATQPPTSVHNRNTGGSESYLKEQQEIDLAIALSLKENERSIPKKEPSARVQRSNPEPQPEEYENDPDLMRAISESLADMKLQKSQQGQNNAAKKNVSFRSENFSRTSQPSEGPTSAKWERPISNVAPVPEYKLSQVEMENINLFTQMMQRLENSSNAIGILSSNEYTNLHQSMAALHPRLTRWMQHTLETHRHLEDLHSKLSLAVRKYEEGIQQSLVFRQNSASGHFVAQGPTNFNPGQPFAPAGATSAAYQPQSQAGPGSFVARGTPPAQYANSHEQAFQPRENYSHILPTPAAVHASHLPYPKQNPHYVGSGDAPMHYQSNLSGQQQVQHSSERNINQGPVPSGYTVPGGQPIPTTYSSPQPPESLVPGAHPTYPYSYGQQAMAPSNLNGHSVVPTPQFPVLAPSTQTSASQGGNPGGSAQAQQQGQASQQQPPPVDSTPLIEL